MPMSFSELLGPSQSFLALTNPAVKQQIRQNDIDLERAKLRLDSSMSPEMPGSRGIATPIEEVLPGKITTPTYQPPSNKMTTPIQQQGPTKLVTPFSEAPKGIISDPIQEGLNSLVNSPLKSSRRFADQTSEDFKNNPDKMKDLGLKKVAINFNGKIYSIDPSEGNHTFLKNKIIQEQNLDPYQAYNLLDKMTKGFVDDKGRFVQQGQEFGQSARPEIQDAEAIRNNDRMNQIKNDLLEAKFLSQQNEIPKSVRDKHLARVQELTKQLNDKRATGGMGTAEKQDYSNFRDQSKKPSQDRSAFPSSTYIGRGQKAGYRIANKDENPDMHGLIMPNGDEILGPGLEDQHFEIATKIGLGEKGIYNLYKLGGIRKSGNTLFEIHENLKAIPVLENKLINTQFKKGEDVTIDVGEKGYRFTPEDFAKEGFKLKKMLTPKYEV